MERTFLIKIILLLSLNNCIFMHESQCLLCRISVPSFHTALKLNLFWPNSYVMNASFNVINSGTFLSV